MYGSLLLANKTYNQKTYAIFINANNGGNLTVIAKIEMRSTVGGSNACTLQSGTVIYSSQNFNNPPDNYAVSAFFGTETQKWTSANGTLPQYIGFRFNDPNIEIAEIVITGVAIAGQELYAPKDFVIKWSYDEVNWYDFVSVTNQQNWFKKQIRKYTASGLTSLEKTAWDVNVTANNGASLTTIAELEMRLSAGGADATSPTNLFFYTSQNPNNNPDNTAAAAFDNNSTTKWTSANSSLPQRIGVLFNERKDIVEFSMRGCIAGQETYAPKNFSFRYLSADGNSFIDYLSCTNISWVGNELKTFSL